MARLRAVDLTTASRYIAGRNMALTALDVGIVGAGTAGAAAALLLARAGHRVTLFEAVPAPGPVGAGIMMQPSGMSVLQRLGLLAPVLARGVRVSGLRCVTHGRWPVLKLGYQRLHPDAFGLGLHRGVLFDALFDAAAVEPNVQLRCGVSVELRKRRGSRQELLTAAGQSVGDFDLVVVADGARSELRSASGLARRDRSYPWGALWFMLEDPEQRFGGELFQVVRGTREMLGFLPSGFGPSGNTPLVSLFWSLRADRVEAFREAGLERWKATVSALEPRAAPLLDQIVNPQQLIFARYHDVVMRPWHLAEGVVFIGDAAHAMSPQLGQGANLALVDAGALADALAESSTLADGLARYSQARRHELNYYQWATRFLTPFFQSDLAPLGWLRDAFMYASCKVPFVAAKMSRTLCGLERGILLADAKPLPLLTTAAVPQLAVPSESLDAQT